MLADNGGPTQTIALLPGSPAIDAGVRIAGITTDQRGVPRDHGSSPDIGAFEAQYTQSQVRRGRGGVAFVTTLYREMLGRVAEPAGLTFWMGRIDAGAGE